MRRHFASTTQRGMAVTTPAMLEELHQRKQVLKKAAPRRKSAPPSRSLALLFQSILTEDRIPASVRVWFARLQMPVLRVAVSEPDFFATTDHPARRLIDRMGACVMVSTAPPRGGRRAEKEIKRIVQVVEAYPDTGRRVFQTVLTEFEKFLEQYFRDQNEVTRRACRWRSRSSNVRRWPSSTPSSCARCSTRCRCRKACASSCSTSGPTCWPPRGALWRRRAT